MFILLRVVAYYVKCFNMLFLFNQGPYWKQVLFYALYMLSFNKTIPKKKIRANALRLDDNRIRRCDAQTLRHGDNREGGATRELGSLHGNNRRRRYVRRM